MFFSKKRGELTFLGTGVAPNAPKSPLVFSYLLKTSTSPFLYLIVSSTSENLSGECLVLEDLAASRASSFDSGEVRGLEGRR